MLLSYPTLLLVFVPLCFYVLSSTPVVCSPELVENHTIKVDHDHHIVFQHTLSYCNRTYNQTMYTYSFLYPNQQEWMMHTKIFYKTVWGIFSKEGIIMLQSFLGFIFFIFFFISIIYIDQKYRNTIEKKDYKYTKLN